eukprot:s2746_g4.t1
MWLQIWASVARILISHHLFLILSVASAMVPLTMIFAFLLMGQTDAGSCPSDQGAPTALMQIHALALTNSTETAATNSTDTCDSLQSVYSFVQVGGGPFAVGMPPRNPGGFPGPPLTQCGRAEGTRTGGGESFCLCYAYPFDCRGAQCPFFSGPAGGFLPPLPHPLPHWSRVTPAEPDTSAERCFRAGQNDPAVVTPSGFDFSCQDPTPEKTNRDPHRSCIFNHFTGFAPQRVQEVPPNTQVVGLCVQQVDNPNNRRQVRNFNSTCQMVTPAPCSPNVRTGRMEVTAELGTIRQVVFVWQLFVWGGPVSMSDKHSRL